MFLRRTVSAAAAALSVGVCVFITYFSRDTGNTTIYFNLGFLALMLVMLLAACIVGLRRLIQVENGLARGTKALKNAAQEGLPAPGGTEAAPLFKNAFLDECYQQYNRMVKHNPSGTCDIRNFINEETVETYVHRGILESIPDILTSLGILGTFVGLVMGLREFDPSGYEQMAGSVTPLINGIKVAFITSIYGIALSLSFSFTLRSEFSNLSARAEEFLDTFYLHVRPPYEVDSLNLLMEQKKSQEELVNDLTGVFVEQMGKSFEQSITPAFARMSDGFREVADAFTQSQEELLTSVCQAVTRQMRQELMADFGQITKSVDTLAKTQAGYTDFMDRTMLRLQKTMDGVQESMEQTQQYLSDSFHQLSAAQGDAYRINQEQKEAYQDYIRFMYQSIEKFSAVWEKNTEELKACSEEIAKMGPVQSNIELKNQLSKLSGQLQDIQRRQEEAMALEPSQSEEQRELLLNTMRKLDDLTDLVSTPRFFRGRKKTGTQGK